MSIFFFFLNDPAPPEFSPFPLHAPLPICMGHRQFPVRDGGQVTDRVPDPGSDQPVRGRVDAVQVHDHRHRRRHPDRKSTRLNSSHSQISYAVFCLKKKKTTSTSVMSTHN